MCWECCCDANKLAKKKKEKRKKKLIEERRKAGVNVHTCTPHNITLISELAHRQSDANQKKKNTETGLPPCATPNHYTIRPNNTNNYNIHIHSFN